MQRFTTLRPDKANVVQLGAGGSVIANAGFIKQFGTRGGEGVRALNPTWGENYLI